jgi:hypothetical protein
MVEDLLVLDLQFGVVLGIPAHLGTEDVVLT